MSNKRKINTKKTAAKVMMGTGAALTLAMTVAPAAPAATAYSGTMTDDINRYINSIKESRHFHPGTITEDGTFKAPPRTANITYLNNTLDYGDGRRSNTNQNVKYSSNNLGVNYMEVPGVKITDYTISGEYRPSIDVEFLYRKAYKDIPDLNRWRDDLYWKTLEFQFRATATAGNTVKITEGCRAEFKANTSGTCDKIEAQPYVWSAPIKRWSTVAQRCLPTGTSAALWGNLPACGNKGLSTENGWFLSPLAAGERFHWGTQPRTVVSMGSVIWMDHFVERVMPPLGGNWIDDGKQWIRTTKMSREKIMTINGKEVAYAPLTTNADLKRVVDDYYAAVVANNDMTPTGTTRVTTLIEWMSKAKDQVKAQTAVDTIPYTTSRITTKGVKNYNPPTPSGQPRGTYVYCPGGSHLLSSVLPAGATYVSGNQLIQYPGSVDKRVGYSEGNCNYTDLVYTIKNTPPAGYIDNGTAWVKYGDGANTADVQAVQADFSQKISDASQYLTLISVAQAAADTKVTVSDAIYRARKALDAAALIAADAQATRARQQADAAATTSASITVADAAARAGKFVAEADGGAITARNEVDAAALRLARSFKDVAAVAAQAASDATSATVAQTKANEAVKAAADARIAANLIEEGRPGDIEAEEAAVLAKEFADEALRDARDAKLYEGDAVAARDEAFAARDSAITEAGSNAPKAREYAIQAREAATLAEEIAADIAERTETEGGGTIDPRELDASAAAAAAAREAAIIAAEVAMAPQSALDTQNSIVAEPTVEMSTGKTSFTFAKNVGDRNNSIDYAVSVERSGKTTSATLTYGVDGGTKVSGDSGIAIVDNGNGTITATFTSLPGSENDAAVFSVKQRSWERESTTPTVHTPEAPTGASLSGLLTMQIASDGNDTCESINAPGTLEGDECVTKSPLRFDTRAYEYPTTPLTGRNWVSSGYNETYQSGTESYIATYNIVYGTRPVYSTRRVSKMCQSGMMVYDCSYDETYQSGTETYDTGQRTPVYATRPTYATRWVDTSHWVCDAAPSGWYTVGDCANGYYKRSTPFGVDEDAYEKGPNLRGAGAVVDGFFSDKTWRDGGSSYVANKPRPASEIDRPSEGIHYNYEPASNMYVARTDPDHYYTWKPVFGSLPANVTGWSVDGKTHRDLTGHDTGRYSQDITVHTLGGDVKIRAIVDEGTHRP